MTTQSRSLRLADELVKEPYAWPGGYPRFAVMNDGAALCHECCKDDRESIATTTGHDGWCVTALDINWEDPHLQCDICSKTIYPAYD
jgi:hypothetical protein